MHETLASPDVVVAAGAKLGECPLWDERTHTLYWLDIHGQALHRHEPFGVADTAVDLGVAAGAIALSPGARLVMALPDGFGWCDPDVGAIEPIVAVDHVTAGTRFNDGACDPAGRFVVGTTTDCQVAGAAALYRLGPAATVERLRDGLTIANGLDWSADGTLFYHVDTPTQTVRVFDYDGAGGALSEGLIAVTVPRAAGAPDGIAVDSDGTIWVALWDGAAVHRYAPSGELLAVLPVPTRRPTSVTFGDDDLRTLYITSAGSTGDPAADPYAGALFACRAAVAGQPPHSYASS